MLKIEEWTSDELILHNYYIITFFHSAIHYMHFDVYFVLSIETFVRDIFSIFKKPTV